MGQLQERMTQDMVLRRLRPATQRNYLIYSRKFAAYYRRSPLDLGQEEIRAFLLHCIQQEKLSYETYRQIYAALKFLYSVTLKRVWEVEHIPYPRRPPQQLPVILTTEQIGKLLSGVRVLRYRLVAMACYAAGLRINESCRLRVQDIDSPRMLIHVHDGKRGQQRITILSPRLLKELRDYWRLERPSYWLFPGASQMEPVLPDTVRQALAQSRDELGLDHRCTPHTLRHCFATHLLEAGVDILTIQKLLGHAKITTTMRYMHLTLEHLGHINSPAEYLPPLPVQVGG